ncbi:hypothetical protein [Paracoccus beibuensis]|uniref:hypothetical protein n=1 Tax=Paracoccus beibuensis TaxID=547602 RepID=UPI002240A686|nr:hypothetical protein [Paracoccus beibuensis]
MGHSFTFVIHERDHFVARDMGQGLINAAPGSSVFHSPTASPCPAEVLAFSSINVLITDASVAEVGDLPVAHPWLTQGWPVVLRMGFDSVDTICAKGWHVLTAPFNWDDLRDLVQRLTFIRSHQAVTEDGLHPPAGIIRDPAGGSCARAFPAALQQA